MATVEVRLSALPAHVRTARLIASAVARRSGLSEDALDELRLAVGEATSRAVGLHRQHAVNVPVTMFLSHEDERFSVVVLDEGPPPEDLVAITGGWPVEAVDLVDNDRAGGLDAAASGDPVDDLLPAGFGLAVIAGLVDDVQVSRPADAATTEVRMTWPLPLAASVPRHLV